jgi:hypothetical protein
MIRRRLTSKMSRRKKAWWAVFTVAAVLIGYGVYRLREFGRDLTSEYDTATVIDRVTTYVETHNGQWPTNWDEIEPWPGVREVVVIQFDVDIDRLIDDPEAIHSTIVPITGPYGTYPHAREDLERLRATLKRMRLAKTAPRPTGALRHPARPRAYAEAS